MTRIIPPIPRTPWLDPENPQYVAREWFRFLQLLVQAVDGTTDFGLSIALVAASNPDPIIPDSSGPILSADSYASLVAGESEVLGEAVKALNPQVPGPVEIGQMLRALDSQIPFPMPPTELGWLQAAANTGYRIAAAGNAVLVGGTVTVNTIYAASTNEFLLTNKIPGGTAGLLSIGTIVANTSFVINSANALDTSTVSWAILKPVG